MRRQARSAAGRRKVVTGAAAHGLDDERTRSFFAPGAGDKRISGDLVAALAGFHPQLMLDAAAAIPRFQKPVLLVWGDKCEFFPFADAERLASDFPDATLVRAHGAKTWVPVDAPAAVAGAIGEFLPPGQPRLRSASASP